jgi:hypothetical protein
MKFASLLMVAGFTLSSYCVYSQEMQTIHDQLELPPKVLSKYLNEASNKTQKVEEKIKRESDKDLQELQKLEKKMQKKLSRLEPSKAKEIFGDLNNKYSTLEQRLNQADNSKHYIPSLDTLNTSLKFLNQDLPFLSGAKETKEKITQALNKVNALKEQFNNAEDIKTFINERRQYLREQLSQLGFAKELKKLNKQAYYYSQQLNEYKELLKDHKKAEKKALEMLTKTKLFRDFMRKNSQLASLFRLPGDPNDPTAQASLAGLQTRAQVNNLIQQQLGTGGLGAQQQFQQNVQAAQSQLNELKNKMAQLGRSSSDTEMPEGFKPNNQKTKTLLQRMEFGTNIQSQKPNGYFPTTSDIGFSLGYKLNDKSVIGIGASYKIGWGQNIRNINITHQGAGLRSFVDWKVKGSFWVSGGYEMNYRNEFNRVDALKDLNAWQQSGLVGLSKAVSLKTKFFKKTKLQLLWDFLSYQQVPRTQVVVFRVGYNIK